MVIKLYFEIKIKAVAIIQFSILNLKCAFFVVLAYFFEMNIFILGDNLHTHTPNVSFNCLLFPKGERPSC